MKKYSLTIGGLIVMIGGSFLVDSGWFTEGCSTEIADKIPLLIGGIAAWIGRVRQGDVSPLGFKK